MNFISKKLTQFLKQGLTPEQISRGAVLGALIGVFPLLGFSTSLGLLVAWRMKLNHAVLQGVSQLMTPLQILFIPLWIQSATYVFSLQKFSFSVTEIIEQFKAAPLEFLINFGELGLYCVALWCAVAVVVYFAFTPKLTKFLRSLSVRLGAR